IDKNYGTELGRTLGSCERREGVRRSTQRSRRGQYADVKVTVALDADASLTKLQQIMGRVAITSRTKEGGPGFPRPPHCQSEREGVTQSQTRRCTVRAGCRPGRAHRRYKRPAGLRCRRAPACRREVDRPMRPGLRGRRYRKRMRSVAL